jgi:hypothetical protein
VRLLLIGSHEQAPVDRIPATQSVTLLFYTDGISDVLFRDDDGVEPIAGRAPLDDLTLLAASLF